MREATVDINMTEAKPRASPTDISAVMNRWALIYHVIGSLLMSVSAMAILRRSQCEQGIDFALWGQ